MMAQISISGINYLFFFELLLFMLDKVLGECFACLIVGVPKAGVICFKCQSYFMLFHSLMYR